jgi:hypothetical protein
VPKVGYLATTIVHDTVPAIELTNTQLLTNNAWMVDEVYVDNGGITKHYKRGGENTTGVNYSNIRLTFTPNGNGTTTDVTGSTFNLTWMFTTPDEKNMKLVVNGTVVYNWALVKISENQILQTTPIGNDLVSARYVPAP